MDPVKSLRRGAAVLAALCCLPAFGQQAAQPKTDAEPPKAAPAPVPQAAEKLYREVYGPQHDRAAKADAAEKLAFARKLADGAKLVAENVPLSRLLRRRAAEFASADPAGHALALELLRELNAEGAAEPGILERMADLQEKLLLKLKPADRADAAAELVYTLRLLADEQDRAELCDSAAGALTKARRLVVQQLKSSKETLAEIDLQGEALQQHRKAVTAHHQALTALLKKPDDAAANLTAGLYLLTWKSERKPAAERLAKAGSTEAVALAALLQKEDAEPLALADAFRAAANAPSAGDHKSTLSAHAAVAYKTALSSAEGADALRIKLLLTQLGSYSLPSRVTIRPPATMGGGPVPAALKEKAQLKGHAGGVTAVHFSADGRTLFTADPASLRSWDVAKAVQKGAVADLSMLRGQSVAISPDGRAAAVPGRNGIVIVEVATGRQSPPLAGTDRARTVVFSPDGKTVATNLGDQVKLFAVATGQERASLPIPTGRAGDSSIGLRNPGFSPDGKLLAVASTAQDGPVAVWDLASAKKRFEIPHKMRFIHQLVFSHDNRTLALSGYRDQPQLVESAGGKVKGTLENRAQLRCLAFFPGGAALAAGHFDGSVTIWDLAGPKQVFSVPTHTGRAGVLVAVSPDGKTLATACGDEVKLWTVVAGD